MEQENFWDAVSEQFNTYKAGAYHGATDNIDAVWPQYTNYIKKYFHVPAGMRALDFGCGTGMFCRTLKNLGFSAVGIDPAPKMIDIAKEHLGGEIDFYVGDSKTVLKISEKEGKFDLITSIMVLQFIEDIEPALRDLSGSLNQKGHLLFANHNPDHLTERYIKDTFQLRGSTLQTSIFPRTPDQYDRILEPLGLTRTMEEYVSQSKEFLEKHHITHATKAPKYMILAYQKA